MKEPFILEIKGNSLDDGPGIRSVVFFKGCPLSCIWCHNPESKRAAQEISYEAENCIGCDRCADLCREKALNHRNKYFIDREKCSLCFACADACPAKALTRVGVHMTHDALLEKLLKDKTFYDISGGGVTLSGGEATLCMEWVGELARKLGDNGVHVLLETCGYFNYEQARKFLLPYVDEIYCDIKIFDREKHKKYCGLYNDRILENFRSMFQEADRFGYHIMPRVPLIPGITDTDENLLAIAEYMRSVGCRKTDLLPYNPTWYPKNQKIGVELHEELKDLTHWQTREETKHAKKIFNDRGIEC